MALIAGRRRRRLSRGPFGLGTPEGRTLAIGTLAAGIVAAVAAVEFSRVWRRGSAPLPSETDDPLHAVEEAAAETVEVAVTGFQQAPTHESAIFNLLASFVITFALARTISAALRSRRRVGPFRNVTVGRRHIHHFVPGIMIAFVSGAWAILSRDERREPALAVAFGIGMGLTLDESALLLDLEDVYWEREGLVSVQITLAVAAFLGALALGARFLRRGEEIVLESPNDSTIAPVAPIHQP
jgi:hypothetical protein